MTFNNDYSIVTKLKNLNKKIIIQIDRRDLKNKYYSKINQNIDKEK